MVTHAGTKPPDVYISNDNVTFSVGDEASLLCKIENTKRFVTAHWRREKTKQILEIANFSSDTKPGHFRYHKFYHKIHKISTADEGMYTCFANYYHGIRRASYRLKVRGKQLNDTYRRSVRRLYLPLTPLPSKKESPLPPPLSHSLLKMMGQDVRQDKDKDKDNII